MSRNLNDLGHLFFILFLAPASAKSSALNNVIRPVQIPTTTHCFCVHGERVQYVPKQSVRLLCVHTQSV